MQLIASKESKMNRFCVNINASNKLKLNIPKTFAKTIEASVSKNIKLKGPSRITQHVKMAKSKDTFVLKSGWNEFITTNKIDKNDSLVFTYEGQSSFNVLIFDPSGCEKDAPFVATKIETESEESNASSVQVLDVPHHAEVERKFISISSGCDTASSYEDSVCSARGDMAGEWISCKRKRRDFAQESSDSDEGNRPTRNTETKKPKKNYRLYVVPQNTNLTEDQKEIVDRMAQKAQKGSDLFVKILTKTNTTHFLLNIPSGFACEVFGNTKQTITLLPANLDKIKGCTGTYYTMDKTRCIGWHKFVHKNRLKEGDLCLFELRKQEIRGKLVLTMLVHFETKSEQSTDSLIGVGYASDDEVRTEIISLSSDGDSKSSSEISSYTAQASKRKQRGFLQESSERDKGKRPFRKTEEKRIHKKKFRSYLVPWKTNLTKTQEDIFDRMALKAEKGSDLFAKVLAKSNTYAHRACRLNLPQGFACSFLGIKKQMITLLPANLDKSKGCTAMCYINQNIRYIGWQQFVRKNRLKEGNLCLFELRKQDIRGQLVLTLLVHFEKESEKSAASSVRVGSDTESASDISSHTAQASKRKRKEESRYSDEEIHRNRNKNDAKKTSRPYIIPHKTYLTKAQEEIANRITEKAQKGSEFFVKTLSASSTSPGGDFVLNLPSGFASNVLGDKKRKITLVPANSEKEGRGCSATYRKNKNFRRIGNGWSQFVRRNGLKKGDFCLFELRKEKKQGKLALTLVVHFDH